jgi:hypothetical protein
MIKKCMRKIMKRKEINNNRGGAASILEGVQKQTANKKRRNRMGRGVKGDWTERMLNRFRNRVGSNRTGSAKKTHKRVLSLLCHF